MTIRPSVLCLSVSLFSTFISDHYQFLLTKFIYLCSPSMPVSQFWAPSVGNDLKRKKKGTDIDIGLTVYQAVFYIHHYNLFSSPFNRCRKWVWKRRFLEKSPSQEAAGPGFTCKPVSPRSEPIFFPRATGSLPSGESVVQTSTQRPAFSHISDIVVWMYHALTISLLINIWTVSEL